MQADDIKSVSLKRNKELISLPEAASYLNIHESTVSRKTKSNEIAYYQVGRRKLFDISDLNDYLDSCKVTAIKK